jgi:predicted CopG family antitoxin
MDSRRKLSDEAYNALKKMKNKNESFNDLILRLTSRPNQKDILELAGIWQGSDEEADNILNMIYENRKRSSINSRSISSKFMAKFVRISKIKEK